MGELQANLFAPSSSPRANPYPGSGFFIDYLLPISLSPFLSLSFFVHSLGLIFSDIKIAENWQMGIIYNHFLI